MYVHMLNDIAMLLFLLKIIDEHLHLNQKHYKIFLHQIDDF